MAEIDRFLPEWDVHEVHETTIRAETERVLALALAVPAAPDAIVQALFRARGLPRSGSIEELMLGMGFQVLARSDHEVVLGAAGRPWRPRGGIGPFGEAPLGTVRIAANFLVAPLEEGGTRLSTETRVAAVDHGARRRFLLYWRVVGPFSGLVRRRWLRAVRDTLDA